MKNPNDCKSRGFIFVDFNLPDEVTLKEEDGATITIEVAELSDYLEAHQEVLQDIIDRELERRKPVDNGLFEVMAKATRPDNVYKNPLLRTKGKWPGDETYEDLLKDLIEENSRSDADPGL